MYAVNSDGAGNVAEASAAAGARRLVLVSSVAVYGGTRRAEAPITEAAAPHPASDYGRSKLDGEKRILEVAARAGIDVLILRMATIYGMGDPGNFARLIRLLARGVPFLVDARHVRKSVVHRADAATACVLAALAPAACTGTYNVVAGIHPLEEIVDIAAAALGRARGRPVIPRRVALALTAVARPLPRLGALARAAQRLLASEEYDGTRFRRVVGFVPTVSLAEGLREEIAWLGSTV